MTASIDSIQSNTSLIHLSQLQVTEDHHGNPSKIILLHKRQPADGRLNPSPPALPSQEHLHRHWPHYIRHQRLCLHDKSSGAGRLLRCPDTGCTRTTTSHTTHRHCKGSGADFSKGD